MSTEIVPKYSWSKWIVALLIGLPAVGGAYYFIRKNSHKVSGSDQNGIRKPKKVESPLYEEDSAPIVENEEQEETPYERSLKLKNAGNAFYKRAEYRDAVRCYTEAIALCPPEKQEHLSTLYQNRAASFELLNDLDAVVKDCNVAIQLKPDYTKALTRRYKACEKLGQIKQALEDVTAVCLLEKFGNMETLGAADRILKAIGKEEADKFFKNRTPVLPSKYFIKSYFASFTQDSVLMELDSVKDAEEPFLRGLDKAKKALLEERYDDIEEACNEEIAHPRDQLTFYKALLLRASIYILTCQILRCMTDLTKIVQEADDVKLRSNALLKRACLFMQSEDSTKAFEDFALAAEIDPENPDIPHQRAQMYLLSEKIEEACEDFKRAQDLNPKSGLVAVQKLFAEYRLAITKGDLKLVKVSKAGLQQAIQDYPGTPEAFMLLAQVYNDVTEYENAEATFDAGIKADDKNATILVHKGLLYLQWKGDTDMATKMMEKAIEIDPKCEFAYETLASIEVQKGNLARAVKLFDNAIPLAKSEREASHILSLKAAAEAQLVVARTLRMEPIGV